MRRIPQSEVQKIIERVTKEAKAKTGTWSLATCNEIRKSIPTFNEKDIQIFMSTILNLMENDTTSSSDDQTLGSDSNCTTSVISRYSSDDRSSTTDPQNVPLKPMPHMLAVNTPSHLSSTNECKYKLAQLCCLLHNMKIFHVETFLCQHFQDFERIAKNVNTELPLGEATSKLIISLLELETPNTSTENARRRSSASNLLFLSRPMDQNSKLGSKTPEPSSLNFSKPKFI
ncbi:hypothetical protein TRFO_15506 [Tritrichomonas foetus]|uniref:Uncharacterized protein n=1 Tax=Tritrichomonas foetus TaxID=1144522 RepID=A0A1J4KSH4_9EUKA|nr:hypothetical protein TRFO_15506 [Tritrichomonas foetus]|eukprot:OHT14211.1 hypothetical protein TRFO_15506 [Tritrichomonas foetus]